MACWIKREVTPWSVASICASRTSRAVARPASCRRRMRAAIRDLRQQRSKVVRSERDTLKVWGTE